MEPKEKDKKDRGGLTEPHKHEKDIKKHPRPDEEEWDETGTISPQDDPSGGGPNPPQQVPPPPGP